MNLKEDIAPAELTTYDYAFVIIKFYRIRIRMGDSYSAGDLRLTERKICEKYEVYLAFFFLDIV